jgi:hypothetical protein
VIVGRSAQRVVDVDGYTAGSRRIGGLDEQRIGDSGIGVHLDLIFRLYRLAGTTRGKEDQAVANLLLDPAGCCGEADRGQFFNDT